MQAKYENCKFEREVFGHLRNLESGTRNLENKRELLEIYMSIVYVPLCQKRKKEEGLIKKIIMKFKAIIIIIIIIGMKTVSLLRSVINDAGFGQPI